MTYGGCVPPPPPPKAFHASGSGTVPRVQMQVVEASYWANLAESSHDVQLLGGLMTQAWRSSGQTPACLVCERHEVKGAGNFWSALDHLKSRRHCQLLPTALPMDPSLHHSYVQDLYMAGAHFRWDHLAMQFV